MSRSVNKAILVGNLTRDPEMRYTPDGQPVTTFGVATNRRWKTKEGERREDVEFHNVVAWRKLAELCQQLLKKGRRVYIEGRLQTRSWEGKDGVNRQRTEVVAADMVVLDSREGGRSEGAEYSASKGPPPVPEIDVEEDRGASEKPRAGKSKPSSAKASGGKEEKIGEDEIPF